MRFRPAASLVAEAYCVIMEADPLAWVLRETRAALYLVSCEDTRIFVAIVYFPGIGHRVVHVFFRMVVSVVAGFG